MTEITCQECGESVTLGRTQSNTLALNCACNDDKEVLTKVSRVLPNSWR